MCENCYDTHLSGRVNNSLGKQVISNKVEDHRFALHKDKGFTPLVKKARSDSERHNQSQPAPLDAASAVVGARAD